MNIKTFTSFPILFVELFLYESMIGGKGNWSGSKKVSVPSQLKHEYLSQIPMRVSPVTLHWWSQWSEAEPHTVLGAAHTSKLKYNINVGQSTQNFTALCCSAMMACSPLQEYWIYYNSQTFSAWFQQSTMYGNMLMQTAMSSTGLSFHGYSILLRWWSNCKTLFKIQFLKSKKCIFTTSDSVECVGKGFSRMECRSAQCVISLLCKINTKYRGSRR